MLVRYSWPLTLALACWIVLSGKMWGQDRSERGDVPSKILLPGLQDNAQVLLPNGWSLAPAGTQIPMGDFPVNAALSPDGAFIAVLHAGYGDHEIRIVSTSNSKVVSSASLAQTFYGIGFSKDGKHVWASGGEDERIYLFPFDSGYLAAPQLIVLGGRQDRLVISGIAELPSSNKLLALALLGNQLLLIDPETSRISKRLSLPTDAYPYGIAVSSDEKRAYVSLWGLASVVAIDLESWELIDQWSTPSHPTELILIDEGRNLLVACSDDSSIVLIDCTSGAVQEKIRTSLFPTAKNGSTPASIAVSPDGNVLLAANADNNNVAIFDIRERGKSRSLGFIPVGWYPTSVRIHPSGEKIFVTNGKGMSSSANRNGPNPLLGRTPVREYIGQLFDGTLSVIATPSPNELATFTRTAYSVSPLEDGAAVHQRSEGNPIPAKVGDPSPIRHCIYIIKENRTYDQILDDVLEGNGDPNLCIFPESVTPNHHALAKQFVLLDNFYVESEVSADGHEWTMAAYATDFVEKTWPLSYRGGRGKLTYPSEGKLKIAEPSSGYLWDKCREKGVDYISFGEFINNGPTLADPATTKMEALQGHFDPWFRGYDLDYPDVKRAERFIEKWNELEERNQLPGLIILRLPNDHTYGTRIGKPTPTAMVADNDLALGMVVEAISKSKSWAETAIFVVEDDAQNGADHVDAHRTVALAISPYIRRGSVDSTMYSTSSMLRTMELILGLDPMTQFDAAATPMYNSFQAEPDLTPYQSMEPAVDRNAVNVAGAWGSEASMAMDFSKEDAADDLLLGDIVWRSVRGPDSPMPAPVRSAFVFAQVEDEDEDDDDEAELENQEEK